MISCNIDYHDNYFHDISLREILRVHFISYDIMIILIIVAITLMIYRDVTCSFQYCSYDVMQLLS